MIHALEAMRAYSEARRQRLTRRCQNCAHEQPTPEEKPGASVPCEECHTPIPPKRDIPSDGQAETQSSDGESG
jgi:hypothetical protein